MLSKYPYQLDTKYLCAITDSFRIFNYSLSMRFKLNNSSRGEKSLHFLIFILFSTYLRQCWYDNGQGTWYRCNHILI
jgi:hypothetical protein